MKPRISVLTLGVTNLERSLQFYREGLGLSTEGIVGKEFEMGSVVFFDLQNGLKLALWPRENMRNGSCVKQAEAAGATIVKPAVDTFYGGYAGYFQDPDGHLWEVVWNPQFKVE